MAFDLLARLRLRDDGFSSGMNRAVSHMNNVNRAALRMGAGLAVGVAAMMAAGAAYQNVIVKPLKLASDMEQATIAFTTMLGSASKAQKFLADLTEYANKTPFELPQIRDASKRLLAFGFSLESILPMMTGIGNAASGLGLGAEGIDRITLALGQMKAKAKVSGDEMLQLTEAGIPAWQMLADKMKLSTAQVMKLSEKGLIPADKAINVLIDGMNKRFPNMMEKQSKSLAGLYSTIKDTFNSKILTKWGEGLAAGIKPRLDRLVTWIDRNETTISRWGRTLQTVGGEAADWVAGKFESATLYVNKLMNNPEFNKLDFGGKIKFAIADVRSTFNEWYNSGGKEQITEVTGKFVGFLSDQLVANAPKFVEMGLKIAQSILKGIITGLQSGLKDALTPISPWLKGEQKLNNITEFDAKAKAHAAANGKDTPMYQTTLSGKSDAPDTTWSKIKGWFGHAGGLSNVPYNRYPALLHKGERVQTKAEADAERSGASGESVLVTGNTFYVRKDSDIEAIALELAKQLRLNREARTV